MFEPGLAGVGSRGYLDRTEKLVSKRESDELTHVHVLIAALGKSLMLMASWTAWDIDG